MSWINVVLQPAGLRICTRVAIQHALMLDMEKSW